MCTEIKGKIFLVLPVIILIFSQFCRVDTTPERIWGVRGKLIRLAESLKGIPYVYGGKEIDGFDCSGFVYYIYTSFGYAIPRTAKKQGKLKRAIPFKRAKPADILVFRVSGKLWHSGIYVSKTYFIHAPNGRGTVRRERYTDYWMKRLKKVISVIRDE